MLSNIVHVSKSWFITVKELVESENNFEIYVPKDTLTYNAIEERSKSGNEDSFYFKQLLKKVKLSNYGEIQSIDKLQALCDGTEALIFNSFKAKFLKEFKKECDLSVNDLKYDQMNVIRLVRKDYEYSDQMIQM
jgi:hypothetical protein